MVKPIRPMKQVTLVAVLYFLVLQVVVIPASDAKAGMDSERLARIQARMKAFVDKGTIAGAVTLVTRHGIVASLEAVGYQDLENKKPMLPDSIFQKGYGLAWTVVKDPLGTLQLQSIGTFGHGGAFGTEGWIDSKKDLVGVFLIQRSSGGGNEEINAFKVMVAAAISD